MNPIRRAYYLLHHLGPRLIGLRARTYLRKWTGVAKRTFPLMRWARIDISQITTAATPCEPGAYAAMKREHAPSFLFPLGRPPAIPGWLREADGTRQPPLHERVELLRQNRCVYFCHDPSPQVIDWYQNPWDHKRSDPSEHWCDLPDYLPEQGDPRMLWEPSRAAWAIDCARARARGEEVADLYWRWVDSWMEACPPFRGFQWKCGQESAVRLIAIAIGFWAMAGDRETTDQRFLQMVRLAWATGYRIYNHIDYAISQKNNHAFSEACGLSLIASLFPELRDAEKWRKKAHAVIAGETERQVDADGSYVQHSVNYQRVMLQMSILALRIAELAGQPFSRRVYEKVGACGEFLFELMEPSSGQLPLYGNNDGAYVLPLSECDFLDYRPVIQATHYLVNRQRLLPRGAWDEDLLWLFGPEAVSDAEHPSPPATPRSRAFVAGGYYTIRRPDSFAMIRCHAFKDRPAHCDQLHVDLWFHDQNILQDCGTFKYYIPDRPDVEYYFKSVRAHNTIEIDDINPLELVSRFLWLPWPRGGSRQVRLDAADVRWVELEHYDYDRSPWRTIHRRTLISFSTGLWVIVDDLIGSQQHTAVLRWQLLDAPYQLSPRKDALVLHTPRGDYGLAIACHPPSCSEMRIARGRLDAGRVAGFRSPYYGQIEPLPTLEISCGGKLPQRILSVLGPGQPPLLSLTELASNCERWQVTWDNRHYCLDLHVPTRESPKTLLASSVRDAS